jgi:Uma2 family endonuclease
MAARMKSGATYDDLVRLPENVIGELIDGELYASPRPGGPHALFTSVLGMLIGSKYHLGINGPGGWWILFEPELHLGPDTLVPDLAGWRRERMPAIPDGHGFSIVPDWVCETLSGSTERIDRQKKLPVYARHGVPYVWLSNPKQKTVEVLELVDGRWTILGTYAGNDALAAEPFPLAEIDLPLIWGPTPEDESPPA